MLRHLSAIHRTQRFRHDTANKVTLPLIVLRHLRDGQPVTPGQLTQAIRDLKALIRVVDRNRGT